MSVDGCFCACRGLLLCLYRIIVVPVEGYFLCL